MFIYMGILLIATALLVVWVLLLFASNSDDRKNTAFCIMLTEQSKIEELRKKDIQNRKRLDECEGLEARVMGILIGNGSEKDIEKRRKRIEKLQKGRLGLLDILPLPGYALQRRIETLENGNIFKQILSVETEYYGRKYALVRTRHLLAKLLSYPVIGVALSLAVGVLLSASGNTFIGMMVILVGTMLVLVLVYAIYDEDKDRMNKRRERISRQCPNVVSKLALLVTSGMIMDKAWNLTAYSQDSDLYMEMRITGDELENLIEPTVAYTNFINRCNTKETTKLASAIMQNLAKGNSEIGFLLKQLADDSWNERRNNAKQASEKANAKLMIPTMLIFGTIVIMVIAPIMSSFMGGGL